jgi:hypothetical protein
MSYVVQERSQAQTAAEALMNGPRDRGSLENALERQVRQMHRPNAVPVSIVGRAREGKLGEAKLTNIAETLKKRMIDDGSFAIVYLNGTVDRVPHLQGAQTSMPSQTETAA